MSCRPRTSPPLLPEHLITRESSVCSQARSKPHPVFAFVRHQSLHMHNINIHMHTYILLLLESEREREFITRVIVPQFKAEPLFS